ncbi:dihydroxyacetone kinase subunit DhaL [Streptomyces sp. NPDC059637]|uniref:dihydroxyacetone kinase subunit DhaL n=1 Tax=Streptomyces sp. NPDC059637 TaxID=3347752 RepID=UPI0036C841AA
MTAPASPEPAVDALFVRRWLAEAAAVVDREAVHLTELDSAIGDADHGSNMQRGFRAAAQEMEQDPAATPGAVLAGIGRILISRVGGASGPLYGTLLRRAGKALGDSEEVAPEQLREALRAGVDGVAQLGGAAQGDKTMIDALAPAVEAMGFALDKGASLVDALAAARIAAEEGAAATVPMLARKGRASYLGKRSIGHQDPGATSSALLLGALADVAQDGAL